MDNKKIAEEIKREYGVDVVVFGDDISPEDVAEIMDDYDIATPFPEETDCRPPDNDYCGDDIPDWRGRGKQRMRRLK